MTPGFVDRFALSRLHRGGLGWLTASLIAAALGMSSCARLGERSSVVVTPTRPSAAAPTLAAIIGNQLQSGHYASGERALRQYLQQHPGDRAAQGMLRQLTVDPVRELGARWRTQVVQPGDSYSTLADRYLGDANKFLILARYNGSTNPSLLRAGQTLRIPLSASGATSVTAAPAVVRDTGPNRESAGAQAGIVFRSDAARSKKARIVFTVPIDQGPKISYPVAAIAGRPAEKEARAFVDFIASPSAHVVFEEYGFSVLSPTPASSK